MTKICIASFLEINVINGYFFRKVTFHSLTSDIDVFLAISKKSSDNSVFVVKYEARAK